MLKDKVIIVTGGGGGIGEGIARVCIDNGARVVIGELNDADGQRVAAELGDRAAAIQCNVAKDQDLDRLVAFAVDTFGRIDGLVNNAGVNFAKAFLDTSSDDWQHVISVDLRAVFFLTQKVCKQMLIQSPASVAALPGAGPYDAAKAGVVGMSKSIAIEMALHNIRINCVSPGLINTQIWQALLAAAPDKDECISFWNSNIPMNRVIETSEVGEAVCFLLSNKSSAMTGSNMIVDAGMTSQLISKEPFESKTIEGK
jgi:NAD(P)-dependent dehydrogenase (short-subunit alcohol dehydrogenase family)